jgi:hypothetical protein
MSWSELSEKYKYIGQQNDINYTTQINLLDLVQKFIIRKELVLYGGIAIDYALRLKGQKIYNDDDISDYDVYSSDHISDSEEFINELSLLGYRDISAIKALHVQTMRIRWNHIYILDIGYIPKSVLTKIPILKYNRMSFVDPIFQYMDMHYSLCLPFSGAPMENITHRWEKDIKRFNILIKQYPPLSYILFSKKKGGKNNKIKATSISKKMKATAISKKMKATAISNKMKATVISKNNKMKAIAISKNNKIVVRPSYILLEINLEKLPNLIVKKRGDSDFAIAGFGAYAIIRKNLDTIANMLNINLKTTIPKLDIFITEDNILQVEVPDIGDNKLHFVTYKYMEIVNKYTDIKGAKRYRQYLDIHFEHIDFDNISILSTDNKLLSAVFLNLNTIDPNILPKKQPEGLENIYVVSIQYLLLFFLYQFHITNYSIFIEYYSHTLNMIKASEMMFQDMLDNVDKKGTHLSESKKTELKEFVIKIFNNTIFAPIISTFGNSNISTSYIFQEAKKIIELDDIDNIPDILGLKNINFDEIKNLPKNIYPNKKAQTTDFYKNPVFNRDGGQVEHLEKKSFFD